MYMLCRGVPRENVLHIFERVSFIVFNYDRCVEQFLISALERAYSITRADAAAVVDKLEILHPYGSVGRLGQVAYGNSGANCVPLAEQIKTYTEQADEETVLNTIRGLVDKAECVVFLGFTVTTCDLYNAWMSSTLRPRARRAAMIAPVLVPKIRSKRLSSVVPTMPSISRSAPSV